MPQARGVNFKGVFFEEYVYGEEPPNPEGFKFYASQFTLAGQQNLLASEILTGMPGEARPGRGNVNPSGDLVTELGAEWIVPILKHTLGDVQTSGVGPYTHVVTPADLPAGGLTFEKDHGPRISGNGRYERFYGVRPNTMNVEFPVEGYIGVTWGLLGRDHALASAVLDAAPVDDGHRSMTSFNAQLIEEGGSAIGVITNLSINYSNNLDESIFALGGGGRRAELPEGRRSVGGSFTTLFRDAALLEKAINDTETSLKIRAYRGTGDGTAGNGSVEFFIPKLVLERTSVPVNTAGGLRVDFNYRGYQDVEGTPLYQITVKNMSDLAAS
jgi:hypothetical protein